MGHMGRKLASLTGKKADRLTGKLVIRQISSSGTDIYVCNVTFFFPAMDPAEPYYGVMDPSIWVSKDDAEFVDVIHVNSDTLLGVR